MTNERDSSTVLAKVATKYSQVDVVFHEAHACIARPALLVVVADDILVVRVWVFCEIALDQISCLFRREPSNKRTFNDNLIIDKGS